VVITFFRIFKNIFGRNFVEIICRWNYLHNCSAACTQDDNCLCLAGSGPPIDLFWTLGFSLIRRLVPRFNWDVLGLLWTCKYAALILLMFREQVWIVKYRACIGREGSPRIKFRGKKASLRTWTHPCPCQTGPDDVYPRRRLLDCRGTTRFDADLNPLLLTAMVQATLCRHLLMRPLPDVGDYDPMRITPSPPWESPLLPK
jgi:hypothetical protein